MDQGPGPAAGLSLVATGLGHLAGVPGRPGPAADPAPWLRRPKLRKFMARQDDLALVAAGRALDDAGLAGRELGPRAGIFLAVGYIPFAAADLERLLEASCAAGEFSPARFAAAGLAALSPLAAFHCLPNMPAFHVSANFGVRGRCFVGYPGPGQFYGALEEAGRALREGEVDLALAGGVAHQDNFLVEFLRRRLDHPAPPPPAADGAGWLVLEREADARRRGAAVRARALACRTGYRARDPLVHQQYSEEFRAVAGAAFAPPGDLGAAALPAALGLAAQAGCRRLRHRLRARDGLVAESLWALS